MSKIFINGKFLDANLNGVHRTAAHYSKELIKRAQPSHEVRLVTPRATAGHPEFQGLVGEVVSGGFGTGQGWEMLTLPRAARDALLVNFCNLAPLLHDNSLVMIHDAQTFLFPEDYSGRQATFYRLLLPLIARRARRILTVSEFSRQSLVKHGVGTLEKIKVVHNGTDHILDTPADPAILARKGLVSGGYVLTLGSTKGYKNIRSVFAAMQPALAANLPLVVAGGRGEEAYRAAGWNPPEGTLFTGFVSDGELRSLYEGAALFVFPSLTEGFGLPPVEAMHCGAPVVAARAGAMPEVLGDAAVLVNPGNPAEYRQAIEAILADPAYAGQLRARGKARAAQLSWDAAGDKLFSIIRDLLRQDAR